MGQSYQQPETNQFPLARLARAFWMKTGPVILLLIFSFLMIAFFNANAQNVPAGDPNKVLWQNPTPQLSPNAKRALLAVQLSGLDSSGYVLVLVKVEAGKATEVRSLMSSGAIVADQEICQFVLDHWVFNPKVTGVYRFPVLLPPGL